MEPKLNTQEKGNKTYNVMNDFDKYVFMSSYEKSRSYIKEYMVSQINICAYCVINKHMTGVDL